MGFVFGARGLTMEGTSSFFLPRLVGLTRANDYVLTARIFTCKEEEHSGLFTRVVPREAVLSTAVEIAQSLLLVSPISTMVNRHLLQRGFADDSSPESAHLNESRAIAGWPNPDNEEGVASFLEKRAPDWKSDAWR